MGLLLIDIREYGVSFFNFMIPYREQDLWFTLLVWYGIVTDHRRRVWAISLTLLGLVCLVSLHHAYSGVRRVQGTSSWFQVYERFGSRKENGLN